MELTVERTADLTRYERSRIAEIRDWYVRQPGTVDRLLGGASDRARWILDRAMGSDRVREATEHGATRVLEVLDEQLLRDIDEEVPPEGPLDPSERERALRRVDERAAQLRTRYVGGLSGQAAVAGAASLTLPMAIVAMAADVAGAVLGSLRAAAHTLMVYGARSGDPGLIPASVGLVAAASETEASTRRATVRAAVLRLVRVDAAAVPVTDEIPRVVAQQASSRAAKEAVEQIARRMVRRRAVRIIPVLGAVASASASAWLAGRVCEAATNAGAATYLHRRAQVSVEELLSA